MNFKLRDDIEINNELNLIDSKIKNIENSLDRYENFLIKKQNNTIFGIIKILLFFILLTGNCSIIGFDTDYLNLLIESQKD